MSTKLITADIDPERGVMLRLDFPTYADTLDCIVSFLTPPHTEAHVRYDLVNLLCTI